MKEQQKNTKTWISFRVKPNEYDHIDSLYRKSTCNSFSEYARKTLQQEPVTIRQRNQSADELLASLLTIKKELNAIGVNLNQSVKKLQAMKDCSELNSLIFLQQAFRENFLQKVESIKVLLVKLAAKWL